jgi:AAA+ ATPase superfamily predicted ATPase
MKLPFVNREAELRELDRAAKRGGLLVIYGRRRIGKTRLLRQWLAKHRGFYRQAIEAQPGLQIQQVFADLKSQPDGCLLILAGSSTQMMQNLFLHPSVPLYGRASKLINLLPMDYAAFCRACRLKPNSLDSFEKFASVGGIPKYWEFVEPGQDAVAQANALYFDFAPYMEQEPQRILRDEGIAGLNALAVLGAVGRGAERPSEIASRLATAQTNLSRLLQQLLDTSILTRELPFGESVRSTKKVLYRIQDPTMRFWFRVYSPHRSLWPTYAATQKQKLIHDHAATVFEDYCRTRYPGAQRYWESRVEFDLVAPDPEDARRLLVAKVKWRRLTAAERRQILS